MLLIGDVHGKHKEYLEIINTLSESDESIQLGDFGFDYDCIVGKPQHKILGGNHDNYDKLPFIHNDLGNFGQYKNIFYVRGAQSIDKQYRIPYHSWWPTEELSYKQLDEAITLYSKLKPEIVISHTCPKSIIPYLGGKADWGSVTEIALEQMLSIHQPLLWVFGHFHVSRNFEYERTRFICLNELETLEL